MMENAQTLVLDTVNGLIEDNEIEKALDTLKDLDKQSGADIWQDLTLQYSNYRSAKNALNQGRIDFNEFRRYEAQAKYALTELMKTIPRRVAINARIKSVGAYVFEVPEKQVLEKMLGPVNNLVRMDWFEKIRKVANAICRIVCEDGTLGTGFLTQDGYVFTNHHVLKSADVAKTARLEFNFNEEDGARTTYQLDASGFITSEVGELDFSRVKVIDRADAPLSNWGFVEFDTETLPLVGEDVTIIQHPRGGVKQANADKVLGLVNQHLYYSTQTDGGSSGSPVLNKACKVIALHHAGMSLQEGGYIINNKGERAGANEGILFRDIFAFIKK